MEERFVTTVDPGTSSLKISVSKISNGNTEVIYFKQFVSDGIRYGCVFNPKKAAGTLQAAVKDAENELGISILQAVVVLPRFGVRQIIASGSIARENGGCIEKEEVESVRDYAIQSYPLEHPESEIIYGAQAQSFGTDSLMNLSEDEVVGMISTKLEGNFKIFIGQRMAYENIDAMFNLAGLAIADKVFLPSNGAESVLSENDKENGVALVEIGAGVTSVTVYQGGLLRHFKCIPLGADSITNDIKYIFGQKKALSENIKLAFGSCDSSRLLTLEDKIIQINNDEDGSSEQIQVRELSEVIEARMREIMEAVLYHIDDCGLADKLRAGIVLCGGGACLRGLVSLTRDMSGYNVRVGFPRCKSIITEGCNDITEAAAMPTMEAILASRGNVRLNCSLKPEVSKKHIFKEKEREPETVKPVEEGNLTSLFTDEPVQKKEKPVKKTEPGKTGFIWGKVKGIKDDTLGIMEDLFGQLN